MNRRQKINRISIKLYSFFIVLIMLFVMAPSGNAFAIGRSGFVSGPGGQANTPAIATESSMDVYSAYGAADVAVCKVVKGDDSGKARLFEFTIFFQDEDGRALADGEEFIFEGSLIPGMGADAPDGGVLKLSEGGTASLFLKHGQIKIIKDVPAGAMIDVLEAESGYTTKHTESEEGPLIDGKETEFLPLSAEGLFIRFENALEAPPSMGIKNENTKAVIYFTALSILSCIVIVRLVKKRAQYRA